MKYEIAIGTSVSDLVKSVNAYIASGWEPIGGVCVTERRVENDGYFITVQILYQSVVLKDEGAA